MALVAKGYKYHASPNNVSLVRFSMQAHSRKAHFTVYTELNIRIQLAGRKQLSVDRNIKSLIK